MRTFGIILTVIGGLLVLGSLKNAVNLYDFGKEHDWSKFLGGLSFSLLILGAGLSVVKKYKPATPAPPILPGQPPFAGPRVPPGGAVSASPATQPPPFPTGSALQPFTEPRHLRSNPSAPAEAVSGTLGDLPPRR